MYIRNSCLHLTNDFYLLLLRPSISFTFASTYFPGKDLDDVFGVCFEDDTDDDDDDDDDVAFDVRVFKGVFALEDEGDDDDA